MLISQAAFQLRLVTRHGNEFEYFQARFRYAAIQPATQRNGRGDEQKKENIQKIPPVSFRRMVGTISLLMFAPKRTTTTMDIGAKTERALKRG